MNHPITFTRKIKISDFSRNNIGTLITNFFSEGGIDYYLFDTEEFEKGKEYYIREQVIIFPGSTFEYTFIVNCDKYPKVIDRSGVYIKGSLEREILPSMVMLESDITIIGTRNNLQNCNTRTHSMYKNNNNSYQFTSYKYNTMHYIPFFTHNDSDYFVQLRNISIDSWYWSLFELNEKQFGLWQEICQENRTTSLFSPITPNTPWGLYYSDRQENNFKTIIHNAGFPFVKYS